MWEKTKYSVLFLWNFFRNPMRNASVTPSSVSAARAMIADIDFSAVHTIVEIGPGTGVFTEELLRKCADNTKVILIEIDGKYVTLLRERFGSRVVVEHDSASEMESIVAKHGGKVDLIISGLPVLIPGVTEKLLASIKKYTDGGATYRFFSYVPPLVRRVYRGLPVQRVAFVLLNLPPLWVYELSLSEHA